MGEGAETSRILVIGATGRIGKLITQASLNAGHPTFAFVRPDTATVCPAKANLIGTLRTLGATILYGDLSDHQSLLNAIKQVDVVISAVGHNDVHEIGLQFRIVEAIEEAGNIRRFIPSEFGNDAEQVNLVEPAKSLLADKVPLRQALRAKRIPHTFVCSFFMHSFFLPRLGQADGAGPPTDPVSILGDGNVKAIFVHEEDVAEFTVRSVDDPRTLNKILYVRPPENLYTVNELISLWEKKSGATLGRVYVTEEQVLNKIKESSFPLNFQLAIAHSAFIKGEQTKFEIDQGAAVEACVLYPDLKYITVENFLTSLIA